MMDCGGKRKRSRRTDVVAGLVQVVALCESGVDVRVLVADLAAGEGAASVGLDRIGRGRDGDGRDEGDEGGDKLGLLVMGLISGCTP